VRAGREIGAPARGENAPVTEAREFKFSVVTSELLEDHAPVTIANLGIEIEVNVAPVNVTPNAKTMSGAL
jgi:hypothetical protein